MYRKAKKDGELDKAKIGVAIVAAGGGEMRVVTLAEANSLRSAIGGTKLKQLVSTWSAYLCVVGCSDFHQMLTVHS